MRALSIAGYVVTLLTLGTASEFRDLYASPAVLGNDPVLSRMAQHWQLSNYEAMDGGVLGDVGTARVFVAPLTRIPSWSRLYWTEVRVLSEKYGCFMRSRLDHDQVSKFKCKDGRQVVFWRAKGPNWIRFYARQYDAAGYEIAVRNHQVIRLR